MSVRSSRRDWLVAAAVLCACGKHAKPRPQAKPEAARELAKTIVHAMPAPGAVRECKDADLAGGATLTFRTLLELAGEAIANDPEHGAWINPPALDAPAARVLVDAAAAPEAKGEAAYELTHAPFVLVYHVDIVNAPLALGVKELKRGGVSTTILRFDPSGKPSCSVVFQFWNTQEKSDWAIEKSDRAVVDPTVAQVLKDDLASEYVRLAPGRPKAAPAP